MKYKEQSLLKIGLTERQQGKLNGIARIYPDISCPVYHYNNDGRRVLIISDILGQDDEDNGLLFSSKEREVYDKTLYYALNNCKDLKLERIALVNWQAARPEISEKKTLEDRKRLTECNRVFWSRIKYLIKKYRPDSVIAAGEDPFIFMYRELFDPAKDAVQIKTRFNRVFDADVDGHKFTFTGTIDLYRPCTWDVKYKEFANLLGYLKDGLSQGIQGFNWFTVELPKPKIVYINTIERFDKFYDKLVKEPIIAIDTEGDGKGRLTSKLYCIQFAFSKEKGYFLPIDHPDTPFSPKETKYIKRKLRHYFEFERTKKYHIYQYGKYDIGQFYAQLGIRFYNHRVYDTMGGQFLLNENVSFLKKYGFKKPYTPLSLGVLTAQAGCYIYEEIEFSKGDRGNIQKEGLTKRFIEYSVYDATVLIALQEYQIALAKRARHGRFLLYNCEQISDTLIALAQTENTGAPLDRKQFYILKSKDGPINVSLNKQLELFKESKAAQKVNSYLIKKRGLPPSGMLGEKLWLFNINKQESADLLYYKVLKLKALEFKKDGNGKINKAFLKEYSDDVPDVKTYQDYKSALNLRNNFVNKIYDKIHKDNDTLHDGRLRSSYTYTLATTSRLTSVDPNLQNLTARGDWAPHLKRGFISDRRCALVVSDFSANEIRDWCNQSGDENLRASFYVGLKLRQKIQLLLLENPENWTAWLKYQKDVNWFDKDDKKKKHKSHWTIETEKSGRSELDQKTALINKINDPTTQAIGKIALQIELKADVHKQNCVIVFQLKSTLDVTDEQRFDIKQLSFGRAYGKLALSYAKPVSQGGLGKSEEECEEIMGKFDGAFPTGTKWLAGQHEYGQEHFYTESPLGMRRHLDGYYHTRKAIINAMNRRGPNARIQGTSSHIGVTAIRSMQKLFWHLWVKHDVNVYWMNINNYVHDAIYGMCPISFLPVYLYLLYHSMTTLVHRRFTKTFGYNFRVGLESESNVGGSQAGLKDVWRFDWDSLLDMVNKTIKFHKEELGYNYSSKELEDIMEAMRNNWNVISKIRLAELKESIKSDKAITQMYLTEQNARLVGLIVEGPDGKMKQLGDERYLDKLIKADKLAA